MFRRATARLAASLIVLLVPTSMLAASTSPTFEQRVQCQRRIESVYWNHRTWPAENPQPKPLISAVLPDDVLRARVSDQLRQSELLRTFWHQPLTGSRVQGEIARVLAGSKDPALLQELFAALDNDPLQIAECLARPVLAAREFEALFARDARIHGARRAAAASELAGARDAAGLRRLSGRYSELDVVRDDDGVTSTGDATAVRLDRDAWSALVQRLAARFGIANAAAQPSAAALPAMSAPLSDDEVLARLPLGRPGTLDETDDAFVASVVLSRTGNRLRLATMSWPKLGVAAWLASRDGAQALAATDPNGSSIAPPDGGYSASAGRRPASGSCTPDTWSAMSGPAPDPRYYHTAVWTGTEMIVWGGYNGAFLKTGGRYNPATDSWTSSVLTAGAGGNAPEVREYHTAVWTGTEMIVWGGYNAGLLKNGGRYNPTTDSWAACSLTTGSGANVPAARQYHAAAWTGSEMIVWGGYNGSYLNTGARYNPSTDSWTPTSVAGANVPSARYQFGSAWTGTEFIVWGGYGNTGFLGNGGRYNPATDEWIASSLTTGGGPNAPSARYLPAAVWTGSELIVWGGSDGSYLKTGGRYNPATDSWALCSLTAGTAPNTPSGRQYHSATWTGSELIVWGGFNGTQLGTGGRYNPSTDSWAASVLLTANTENAPIPRYLHTAVWTGSELVVWGGYNGGYLGTGGRYNPATDSWTSSSLATASDLYVPAPRYAHTAVWTGSELIVWGGFNGATALNTGGRYTPATDTWSWTAIGSPYAANTPPARYQHTAIWTGSEMIVWGGYNGAAYTATGGRYDPLTDTWANSSLTTGTGAPAARSSHTAVWTGSEMIVWGGYNGGALGDGRRYDPASDSWTALASGANAPSARYLHTAVWTGSELIVWGGYNGAYLKTGGRYVPATDSWSATSLTTGAGSNVPGVRSQHRAVWTGSEMIVWGGLNDVGFLNTGGRFDPASDSWKASSLTTGSGANVPAPRAYHTAVWTGSELIVWGGSKGTYLNNGGRFNPTTDSWASSSLTTGSGANVPAPRGYHTAVWTGSELIVWGGQSTAGVFNSGGRYDPVHDSWAFTFLLSPSGNSAPAPRSGQVTAWTGAELLVWGGSDGLAYFADGGRYDLALDAWRPSALSSSATANNPAARTRHTAVWTGTELIVWGGTNASTVFNNGGRYNPTWDQWVASSLTTGSGARVPAARHSATAVWTGARMIVWGGAGASSDLANGGVYDPSTDTWLVSSLKDASGANVPSARHGHTAVWSRGNRMVIWGGQDAGGALGTGGRYDAVHDTWQSMTTAGAPAPRTGHSAVWTGREMIVWGGEAGASRFADGARYNAAADEWTAMSLAGAPSARSGHAVAWTGLELIVWGGKTAGGSTNTGGRYNPVGNDWNASSLDDASGLHVPQARANASAAWTGPTDQQLIVWGGDTPLTETGALYCAANAVPLTWYQDLDGDGYGNPAVSVVSITEPAGYVATGDDCDDADPDNFPDNLEVCDGKDNDCNTLIDDGVPVFDYYVDADGDTYGDALGVPLTTCFAPPPGRVKDHGDCNDHDPAINPGIADLTCDGIDQNCSGTDGDQSAGFAYVDPAQSDANDCGLRTTACATIARAVGVACPGTTVVVRPSAQPYAEVITLAKSISIRGDVTGSGPGAASGAPVIRPALGPGQAAIVVTAPNVTIEQLEVRDAPVGISLTNAPGGSIRFVTVRSQALHAGDAAIRAEAVAQNGATATASGLRLEGNLVDVSFSGLVRPDTTNAAIVVRARTDSGTGALATFAQPVLSANQVTSNERALLLASAGDGGHVQSASIASNTIVVDDSSAAVKDFASTEAVLCDRIESSSTLVNNTVTTRGVLTTPAATLDALRIFGPQTTSWTVSNNVLVSQVTELASGAPQSARGLFVDAMGTNSALSISANTLTGHGTGLAYRSVLGVPPAVRSNLITGNGIGIEAAAGELLVSANNISNNRTAGLVNTGATKVNAACNYWGGTPGVEYRGPFVPVLNPLGTGNTITGTATFSPWLRSDTRSCAVPNNQKGAVADRLAFGVSPANGPVGAPLAPPPYVEAQDAGGVTGVNYQGLVTLAITPGTGAPGAVLTGETTAAAIDGAAPFGVLSIDRPRAAYRLTASAAGLANGISSAFDQYGSDPEITGLVPPYRHRNSDDFTLRIEGTGFASDVYVDWTDVDGVGHVTLTPTSVTPFEVVVTVPASLADQLGTAQVRVVDPNPGGEIPSPPAPFEIRPGVLLPAVVDGAPGTDVVVPVTVNPADGVLSLDLRLSFDPAALTPLGVYRTSYAAGFALASDISVPGLLHATLTGGTPLAGTGEVLWILFHVRSDAPGGTALHVDDAILNAGAIASAAVDGQFTLDAATATLSVPDTANGARDDGSATPSPASTVDVPIGITVADGITAATITLRFDPSVVEPVGASATSLSASCTVTSDLTVPGIAVVQLTHCSPLAGQGDLARVRFHVAGATGAVTPLDLQSATLTGGPAAVALDDGLFTVCADADKDGATICGTPADCNDNDPAVGPQRAEITCNGKDDDCNAATEDAPDADHDGFDVCGAGDVFDADGKPRDCNDASASIHPGAAELCNDVDDNCDGTVDENPAAGVNSCTAVDNCTVGFCAHDTQTAYCTYPANGACVLSGTVSYYRTTDFNGDGVNDDPHELSVTPVPGVAINVLETGPVPDAVTDAAGQFTVPSLAGQVTVTTLPKLGAPRADDTCAISSLDAAQVARFAINLGPLTSLQKLAGDVTGNGTLSAFDASLIAQYSVGIIDHFPVATSVGSDWQFLRCDGNDPANCPAWPPLPPAPSFTFDRLLGSETVAFHAVLFGDVTGNWPCAPAPGLASAAVAPARAGRVLANTAGAATATDGVALGGTAYESIVPLTGPRPGSASIYIAEGPARQDDGRVRVVLGLSDADAIQAIDLSLAYDPRLVTNVASRAVGLADGYTLLDNARAGDYRVALYGIVPMRGSGLFLEVVFEPRSPALGGFPFTIDAKANEGLVPLRW